MENDNLEQLIEQIISRISSISEISAEGLKNAPFPDENIVALHSSIGNCKHFISNINNSFNAAEQFNTINMASSAISQANDQLFTLFSSSLINISEFEAISKLIRDLEEQLKRRTEPEY